MIKCKDLIFFPFFMVLLLLVVGCSEQGNHSIKIGAQSDATAPQTLSKDDAKRQNDPENPKILFKVVSLEDWQKSQKKEEVVLSEMDKPFIHLARRDQLSRIIEKYWATLPEFVVLKIEVEKLPGDLKYEANPGGENKYYHLYNGSIPKNAILSSDVIHHG